MLLSRVLVANRGEIAVRLIRGCQKLGITTVAIYVLEDADSPHVHLADESYELEQPGSRGYLDERAIIKICKSHNIQGVLPGYGFLSENAPFARSLAENNILFIGPSVESLEQFGLKHTARELAIQAKVPVVPGTPMLQSIEEAEQELQNLTFPIMVKATAGGGGMGLQVCRDGAQLQAAVSTVKSRGSALFNNAGFFIEKFVESGRHIEAQIFGNGKGDVIFLGERECSVQRRHQKIIEETPSPFIIKHPKLRDQLKKCSCLLASSVNYKSAGTVEFLVDDDTGNFYFLEMNTRLQVEHGITELCYEVDLVQMMLEQADAELQGFGGLSSEAMVKYTRGGPDGHAIEVRVYAENPAKDFVPSPGLLQFVNFPSGYGIRIDTWISTGTNVSPSFDPLLAKVMVHAEDRDAAIGAMIKTLHGTSICGPPNNLSFLNALLETPDFLSGFTTTNMIATRFTYSPAALEFLEPGAYTTIQDYPGRVGIPNGVPPSGPMDSLSFRIANLLVGNPEGQEALEITLVGPRLRFSQPAVIALCGGAFSLTINGQSASTWTRHVLPAGAEVHIGGTSSGTRAYLAIFGGLPDVAQYLGSKSTTPALGWGGYQGRPMQVGDYLLLDLEKCRAGSSQNFRLGVPLQFRPIWDSDPVLYALPGPWFSEDFITTSGQKSLFQSRWTVLPSSNRSGIRLDGLAPEWSRADGGEGGSHPSNMVGFGVTVGAVMFTGDTGVILPFDAQNQTGFIVTHVITYSDLWRLGQLGPGDTVRFRAVTWQQAQELDRRLEAYISDIKFSFCDPQSGHADYPFFKGLQWDLPIEDCGDGILFSRPNTDGIQSLTIRQAGYSAISCVFGKGTYDLRLRAYIQRIANTFRDSQQRCFKKHCVAENFSLLVYFEPQVITQDDVVKKFLALEASLTREGVTRLPSRIIHLPALFDPPECQEAVDRYMVLQRPYASYLPDNVDFIRRSNGLKDREDVKKAYFETPHLVNAVGWLMGLPIYNVIDPRRQLNVPKYNPARTWTRAGSLGSGGTTNSIYPNDGPGGYALWGVTLPGCCWDVYGRKKGFSFERPWLFEPFDQIVFHEVSRGEYDAMVASFKAGLYDIRIEYTEFDLEVYETMVADTAVEVEKLRKVQEQCTALELLKERDLYNKWMAEKAAGAALKPKASITGVVKGINCPSESYMRLITANLSKDPESIEVIAGMMASVWKIAVSVGQLVESGAILAVLEAMKMEITVRAPKDNLSYKVKAILKEPGERVENGDCIILLSKA